MYRIHPDAVANYSLKPLIKKGYLNVPGMAIKGGMRDDLDLTQKNQGYYCYFAARSLI
ncbi:hypothetical protein OUHCRE11_13190 [Enterobacter asburiae]|jgi:hypothetical protein|nr:hypothetical protein ENTKAS01_18810 [Enterobacter sp. AS-1]